MKKAKTLLSFLLSLAMAFSVVQTPVFAEEVEDDGTAETEEVITPADEVVVDEPVIENEASMPAQNFEDSANGVQVVVNAPEGALPEGTTMTVTKASKTAIQAAADAVDVDVEDVVAVDISFSNNGQEIEPAKAISVAMYAENVSEAAQVVHVDDNAKAEIIKNVAVDEYEGSVAFKAAEFSVYAIANPDNRTTVNFYYNGSVVNTQIIKNGEKLYDPSSEVTLPSGTLFKGWHYGSQTGALKTIDELNEMTFEPGTVNVYAETYKAYSITYKAEGVTLNTDTVELAGTATSAEYTVDQAYEVASQSEQFMGWMEEGTSTVYQNGQKIQVSKNLVLVPKISEGYWLTFNENGKGATYVSPVFVANGESATKPADPTRAGYTFAGWYTAAEGGSQFAFGTLSANTTIYAHWTMNQTANYTINYWKQKISDDVDATTKTYDFAESESKSANSGSKVSGSNTKTYTGFYYDHADTNVTVEADGSTVVNVYYNRKVVTVYFYGNSTSNPGSNGYKGSGSVTKTIRGLYEAPLKDGEWDASSHGWYSPSGNGAILLANYDPKTAGYNVNETTNAITTYFYKRTGLSATLYYYNEQADGTFKQVQAVQTGGSTTINSKFAGYELYKKWSGQTGSGNNSNWTPQPSVAANFFDTQYQNYIKSCSSGDSATYRANKTYVISKLKSYDLTYMVNSQSVKTESIKYTHSLAGKDAFTPSIPDGQMFVGWYADPAGTQKFDFASATMPVGGVTVYAKFEAIEYRVFLNTNGGTLPEGQAADFRVGYGNVVQDSALQEPLFTKEGYTLIGWYSDTAMTKPYNFATHLDEATIERIGDAEYREDAHANVQGSLNLYAKWRKNPDETTTLTVKYDAKDGTNAPVDETLYKVGDEATVQTGSKAPEGLVFDHWTLLDAKGNPTRETFTPGETLTINADYADENYVITLAATYVEKHNTFLKYDVNGGGEFKAGTVTEIENLVINSDVTLLTGDVIETNKGYKFKGWDQNKDATEPKFKAGQTVAVDNMENSANTLYAIYDKFFYVAHSSAPEAKEEELKVVDKFDIVAKTAQGYLYGGYYADAACEKSPYTVYGKEMEPQVGVTYYIKEVATTYLQPRHAEVSNKVNKQLYDVYLVTTVDNAMYTATGFYIDGVKVSASGISKTLTIKHGNGEKQYDTTFVVGDVSDNTDGYIASIPYAKINADKKAYSTEFTDSTNGSKNIKAFWETLDGVIVTGTVQRRLTIKDRDNDGFILVEGPSKKEIYYTDVEVVITTTKSGN